MFDYAQHWESLVCGEAHIAGLNDREPGAYKSLAKFQAAFPGRVHLLGNGKDALDALAANLSIDAIYSIQWNCIGATEPKFLPLYTHAVFHGGPGVLEGGRGGCATVSEACSHNEGVPTVHHMVLPDPALDGPIVPLDVVKRVAGTRVFCRHGGTGTFDLWQARNAMCEHAKQFPNDVFLLLNTDPAACESSIPQSFIHLPVNTNMTFKSRFLATCDACLHGRNGGETFGLAVAECAAAGLPVITFLDSNSFTPFMLGPWGLYYDNSVDSVMRHLRDFDLVAHKKRADEYRALVRGFHPLPVMREFVDRFSFTTGNRTVSLLDRVLSVQVPRGVMRSPDSCRASVKGLDQPGWILASASAAPAPRAR